MKIKLLLFVLFVSVLYGSSYDQFRLFDQNKPRGLTDTRSYLEMSNGNYDVNVVHKYRFVMPLAVYTIKRIFNISNEFNIQIFYVINFSITIVSSFLLYEFLLLNGASITGGVLGCLLFLTSRVIVNAQVPLVDSIYFFGIILIVYLFSIHKYRTVYYVLPLLVLMKENILPIALLVLLRKDYCKRNDYLWLFLSIIVSLVLAYYVRLYIDLHSSPIISRDSFLDVVYKHAGRVKDNFFDALTFKGVNDVFSAFGLLYVLVFYSLYKNDDCVSNIDMHVWGLFPISILYSLLSGNMGRMLFTSFPLVLLIVVKHIDKYIRIASMSNISK